MERSEQARVWGAYVVQERGRVPEFPPTGAVVESDGPLVRIHYGTHGTVDHRPLVTTGRRELADLVRRQQEAFAARGEPVRWKVYGADPPLLAEELEAAGFIPDPQQSLLVSEFAAMPQGRRRGRVRSVVPDARIRELAAAGGPHARPLAEVEADGWAAYGRSGRGETVILGGADRVLAVGWAGRAADSDFVVIGGLTGPCPELVAGFAPLARKAYLMGRDAPYCVAEAAGDLRTALSQAGFVELTTVRTYRWAPACEPAGTRPVREIRDGKGGGGLWQRLYDEFGFRPSTRAFPGIDEPVPSVTWSLDVLYRPDRTVDDDRLDSCEAVVRGALRDLTRPGDLLSFLDWQHTGYAFDPHRVGGPGMPPWPGDAYPDGDYYLNVHPDLRFGTFGHPWEHTLCVWGEDLLAAVEGQLGTLLGVPLRRRDRGVPSAGA
ncbi:DUF2716 domain-containing protein [Streptomyces sp. NPDC048018]|uniref:DUF2716 domain-containing protein n=1 Tax=Streptomyces sp. NPDC048018 TaxID=3365499 RepID=UPI00371EF0F6